MTKLKKVTEKKQIEAPWEGDALGVKQVAEYLTPVIASITQPIVISLSAPYGMGKTYFIRHWQKSLQIDGYKTVYFNAWETDFTDNPLAAFMSAIQNQMDGYKEKVEWLTKKGAAYFIRKSVPVLTRCVVRKLAGEAGLEEITDLIGAKPEDFANLAGGMAEEGMKKHQAITASISSFKKGLEELVQSIEPGKTPTGERVAGSGKKLVVFVDELDRCRPSYAIEVLECIKHLFDVSGVIFVLAVDEKQLKATIEKTYGAADGGEGYLRKFIDWRFSLPEPSVRKFSQALYQQFNLEETGKLMATPQKSSSVLDGLNSMIDTIELVATHYKLTLRQVAQIFTDINLYIRTLNDRSPLSHCLGFIASLRHVDALPKETLRSYCKGELDCDKFLYGFVQTASAINERRVGVVKAYLKVMFMNQKQADDALEEVEILKQRQDPHGGPGVLTRDHPSIMQCHAVNAYSRLISFDDPIAWTVYSRLEKTAFLTQSQQG